MCTQLAPPCSFAHIAHLSPQETYNFAKWDSFISASQYDIKTFMSRNSKQLKKLHQLSKRELTVDPCGESWTWFCPFLTDGDTLTLRSLWIFHSPTLCLWVVYAQFPSLLCSIRRLPFSYHDIRPSIQTWIYCDKCHLLILIPHESIVGATPQQEGLSHFILFPPDILSSLMRGAFISDYMCVFYTNIRQFPQLLNICEKISLKWKTKLLQKSCFLW